MSGNSAELDSEHSYGSAPLSGSGGNRPTNHSAALSQLKSWSAAKPTGCGKRSTRQYPDSQRNFWIVFAREELGVQA
jgi:hypothetical protein